MEKLGRKIVCLNQTIRIRFEDGEEMNIVILEEKQGKLVQSTREDNSITYWCSKDSPLAKAILGKSLGETVEYSVSGNVQSVTILEIND